MRKKADDIQREDNVANMGFFTPTWDRKSDTGYKWQINFNKVKGEEET